MKADGTDIVELDVAADRFERSNFVNGGPAPGEGLPADPGFTPQVEISVQTD